MNKPNRKSLLVLSAIMPMVLSAVSPCLGQVKDSTTTTTTTTAPAPANTQAAPSVTPATPTAPATTGNTSPKPAGHTIGDDFIPGTEVLPAQPKTSAQSDEFVQKQKPTMDLALLLYKNNEYRQSLMVLKKLPQNEQVHYYTGLCYKGLGNIKDATTHFAWVAYYAKDARLKQYAMAGIRSTKPSRDNIKPDQGGSTSTIYSSAEAGIRSEEHVHRIKSRLEGEARERERGGNY
jgi:hypothetical protein